MKDENGIPMPVKWITYMIERIGFPIFACCAIGYITYNSNVEMVKALGEMTKTLQEFREQVRADHSIMLKQMGIPNIKPLSGGNAAPYGGY